MTKDSPWTGPRYPGRSLAYNKGMVIDRDNKAMNIKLSPGAVKYLKTKDASEVTIYLVDIETTGSIGAVREVGVRPGPPKRPENFRYDSIEGFGVYVARELKITGPIIIKKQGFWKLSWLSAEGLHIPL